MAQRIKNSKKNIEIRTIRLRNSLWPDADVRIWNYKTSDGWLTIPRSMPLILRIMDSHSKGQPVSATYLDLWCRTYNNGFVTTNRRHEMAFFSGFDGERAQRTWLARIKILQELGFIDIKDGSSGKSSYILIENPYRAIKKLKDNGLIFEKYWNALVARMLEIGATDIDDLIDKRLSLGFESDSQLYTCTGINNDIWTIYQDRNGEWRWRLTAQDGEIVGASSAGYTSKSDCINNAHRHGMNCNPE